MEKLKYILLIALCLSLSNCKKFLDVKPDAKLAVPSDKLEYLQLLLDDTGTMNQYNPGSGDIACDDSYIPDVQWTALLQVQRTSANAYIWEKDIFNDSALTDWSTPYAAVFYCNLVFEGLDKLDDKSESSQWKEIKGSALFYRAYAYFNLLQIFAKGYNPSTANTDAGIVLKAGADINEKLSRASVQQCYDLIVKDIEEAKTLLRKTTLFTSKPSTAAAAGLLARVYLVMQKYDMALKNAEEALSSNSLLIDYNTLNANANFPIARFNKEVVFHSTVTGLSGVSPSYGRVSSELYNLYPANDLRRNVYYKVTNGDILYKGSYNGSSTRFNGITTGELMLIAAECYARGNDLTAALKTLNGLLVKRWKAGSFTPVITADQKEALGIILVERRKELAFRNRRWSDLKRLNQETAWQKTITRVVNNKTYTLEPGDSRYAMPIPEKVVRVNGFKQN